MRYVRLGRTNLEVSAIAFGTWAFGGEWGAFDVTEAKGAIKRLSGGHVSMLLPRWSVTALGLPTPLRT